MIPEEKKMTDNEVIAQFMEVPILFDRNSTKYYDFQGSNNLIHSLRAHELNYRTSWDWLMPVVQTIEDIEEPVSADPTKGGCWPYQVEILSRSVVQIIDNRTDESIVLVDDQHHRKIDAVYKAVVEFINWYNNTQQKP